jgi:hypothetical protein
LETTNYTDVAKSLIEKSDGILAVGLGLMLKGDLFTAQTVARLG